MTVTNLKIRTSVAAFAFILAGIGLADGAIAQPAHGAHEMMGQPGTRASAARTVEITIRDNLYEPETVQVKGGETIRFVIRNTGELLHEFNIGTAEMHAAHQKEMAQMVDHGMLTATGINQQMMGMDHSKLGMPALRHDDPNAVLVEPGKTAEIVWKFSKKTKLEFACNIPGHYEAGMVGQFHFRD